MASCAQLSTLSDFSDYVDLLDEKTGFNARKLENCKAVICQAVYGTGNPDISGIGVVIGYVVETALGFCLAALLLLQIRLTGHHKNGQHETVKSSGSVARSDRASMVLVSGMSAFFDSAIYFSIALQVATVVVVVKKDYGLATNDFGAIEANIAHAVSVLSLLPLLYPVVLLDSSSSVATRDPRSNPRLFLLNFAVSLSFYPFISRCIHGFGSSPISDGESGEVSPVNWHGIEMLCFSDGLDSLRSNRLYGAIKSLELAASLVVYITTLWQQLGLLAVHYHPDQAASSGMSPHRHNLGRRILAYRERINTWMGGQIAIGAILLSVPLGLAGPLLWVIFYLRPLQENIADAIASVGGGGGYSGSNWGFGQVISVVMFMPVAVTMFYKGRFGEDAELNRGIKSFDGQRDGERRFK